MVKKVDFEFLGRALFHYSKKFEDMKSEESIKPNNMIKKDFDENAEKSSEVARQLLEVQTQNTIADHRSFIDSAVKAYLNDLEKTKESAITKLGEENMKIYSLNNINGEIQKANDWLSDEPKIYRENN